MKEIIIKIDENKTNATIVTSWKNHASFVRGGVDGPLDLRILDVVREALDDIPGVVSKEDVPGDFLTFDYL